MFSSPRTFQAIAGSLFALAIAAPVSAAKFTITIDDANTCNGTWQTTGDAVSPTVTCVTGTPPPVDAPVCNITPSQTITQTGTTTVSLTLANCTAPGGGPLTYSWRQGATEIGTTSTVQVTPTATTTYSATATDTASGKATTYQTTVTVTTATPAGNCSSYTTVNLGDLKFDGTQVESVGMRSGVVAYGRIVIPNPLPAGWTGKTTSLSVFEYASSSTWKKVYLSKTPCDFPTAAGTWTQGVNANLYLTFGTGGFLSTVVQPGDVWYVMIKNENFFNTTSSCTTGLYCNFGLRLYPPSN